MKVKLATFKSSLKHSLVFDQEQQQFLSSLEQKLGFPLELTTLEDYDCDLKLLFVQTGGAEGLFLKALPYLQAPFYLLTNGGNNSLAASLEIATYLKLNHLSGEILHGDTASLAKRIQDLGAIEGAKKALKALRLGIVGKPSDWLIASIPSQEEVKNLFGIELLDIPLSILVEKAKMPHFSEKKIEAPFSKHVIQESLSLYEAMKEIIASYHLNGVTIRCFDLLTSLKRTGCLALALLNEEHIIGTCEGDVMAMLTMSIVYALYHVSTFQANPAVLDTEHNDIIFAHCTVPFDMVSSYELDTHFESGIGLAIKGHLPKKRIIVFRLSSDLKHYFLATGEVIEDLAENNLCRTQIKVHMDCDVHTLLKNPCGNHHIIFYGEDSALLEELLANYGLERIV